MSSVARAPGKLVILGEYAVLEHGAALVMAIDRSCVATIGATRESDCALKLRMACETNLRFAATVGSGVELVDLVTARWPAQKAEPWSASIDSRGLFSDTDKLGLGSSAAALVAWAGAWRAFNGQAPPPIGELIALHRARQGGGSGLDVAASARGGVTTYRLSEDDSPEIGSATLPDGVAFVAVSTRRAASTATLLDQFSAWRAAEPRAAAARLGSLRVIAMEGVDAAVAQEPDQFLASITAYGEAIDDLGRAMGADIVTAEHRSIARIADRCGVAYKVSGAGGGDAGLAFAASTTELDAFVASVPGDCEVLNLNIDPQGLVIEDTTA